ncbi:hypothetical protein JOE29_001263 [Pseudomonas sp. PvP009]|uniref:hypothetical protein n=1 Tax=Pseudomonas sp. PvP009 TaxID=2806584 RepID=UPI001AE90EEC|nr:hypothetical protein [Pseudomonas sp. PvP009]MBP1139312.1 hypothetical protein [Pseudomonas sp. PvP009]
MSIGSSGRIVIEIDPSFKRELYSALAKDAKSLKEWFLESAQVYVGSGKISDMDNVVHNDQTPKLPVSAGQIVSGGGNE